MALQMTHEIAHAAAMDAGNRSMRKAGRTVWNEDDRDACTAEFHRLMPCPAGVGCELCERG